VSRTQNGALRVAFLIGLIAITLIASRERSLSAADATPAPAAQEAAAHPEPLAIGSPAPAFRLPGVDGKTYTLASFKNSKVLVVVFTAVHCPTAEIYENRIKQLTADYRGKSVSVVAIQPNNAAAVRLDEMGYTDLGDSRPTHIPSQPRLRPDGLAPPLP
jgi:hypothetical protein